MPSGDSNKRRLTRPIELGKLEVARRKAAAQLKVFVAGPYVDPHWDEVSLAATQAGARLRAALIYKVEALQHLSVLGEHSGVSEVTTSTVETHGNIVLSELALVDDADAVIIIPDSPGSFCELGSWVMREDFPPKTLILGNHQFESIFGYVSHGVFLMARDMSAQVHWVDYEDHDGVSQLVEEFLSFIQDRKVARGLRRGG